MSPTRRFISSTSASSRAIQRSSGRRCSISSARRIRASGVRRSCESPASRVVRPSRRSCTSWVSVLIRRASAASSRGPDSGRRSGRSPRPSVAAAASSRCSGSAVRRASHHAAPTAISRPATNVNAIVATGCAPTRLCGKPSQSWRPPLGNATQCQSSPSRRALPMSIPVAKCCASACSSATRYGPPCEDTRPAGTVVASSRMPCSSSRCRSKAGRVCGGSSLQVSADSARSSPKSLAARRAIGSISSDSTATAATSSNATKTSTRRRAFCCVRLRSRRIGRLRRRRRAD